MDRFCLLSPNWINGPAISDNLTFLQNVILGAGVGVAQTWLGCYQEEPTPNNILFYEERFELTDEM